MKQLILAITLFGLFNVFGQNCKAYLPTEVGTKVEYTDYNAKGKEEGKHTQEIKSIENSGDTVIFKVSQTGGSGKDKINADLVFKCLNDVFYVDMSRFMSQMPMDEMEGAEMKVMMEHIEIPASLAVGQKLKDGRVTIKISAAGMPMSMDMVITIKNRKVEAQEEVTTPAGTFSTFVISQDIIMNMMGREMKSSSKDWLALGVGPVKNESYSNGKLNGSSVITSITKP